MINTDIRKQLTEWQVSVELVAERKSIIKPNCSLSCCLFENSLDEAINGISRFTTCARRSIRFKA